MHGRLNLQTQMRVSMCVCVCVCASVCMSLLGVGLHGRLLVTRTNGYQHVCVCKCAYVAAGSRAARQAFSYKHKWVSASVCVCKCAYVAAGSRAARQAAGNTQHGSWASTK